MTKRRIDNTMTKRKKDEEWFTKHRKLNIPYSYRMSFYVSESPDKTSTI